MNSHQNEHLLTLILWEEVQSHYRANNNRYVLRFVKTLALYQPIINCIKLICIACSIEAPSNTTA